jgi:hypothetical protein
MIRLFSILIALGVAAAGYVLSATITSDAGRLDQFSYWGTVVTLVGLLLTVGEILHSLKVTKSVQEQSLALLRDVQRVESASTISDCLAVMDLLSKDLIDEKYGACLAHFQHFRRLYVKTVPLPSATFDQLENHDVLDPFGEIELTLMKAAQIRGMASLSKPQKNELQTRLLRLKQHLEAQNPARRTH